MLWKNISVMKQQCAITHEHTNLWETEKNLTHLWQTNTQARYVKGKGKAVPLQTWSGPEGSRKDFMMAQDGGKGVSPTHRPPFTSRKYTWYSFLSEAESTSGP
jgi:hypothetical protein